MNGGGGEGRRRVETPRFLYYIVTDFTRDTQDFGTPDCRSSARRPDESGVRERRQKEGFPAVIEACPAVFRPPSDAFVESLTVATAS